MLLVLSIFSLKSGCRGAAELVITGIDPQTSGASACRIQRSELGFILELENCSFVLLESS